MYLSCAKLSCYLGDRACKQLRRDRLLARLSRPRHVTSAIDSAPQVDTRAQQLSFRHVLVAVLDTNPYLAEGSRSAISTAASLAKQNSSKVTVLLVDEKGDNTSNAQVRIDTLNWHLRDSGIVEYEVVEKEVESKSSALIGDVADDVAADVLVVSADAVHSKRVDANLLAEFVPCPVLLLP